MIAHNHDTSQPIHHHDAEWVDGAVELRVDGELHGLVVPTVPNPRPSGAHWRAACTACTWQTGAGQRLPVTLDAFFDHERSA